VIATDHCFTERVGESVISTIAPRVHRIRAAAFGACPGQDAGLIRSAGSREMPLLDRARWRRSKRCACCAHAKHCPCLLLAHVVVQTAYRPVPMHRESHKPALIARNARFLYRLGIVKVSWRFSEQKQVFVALAATISHAFRHRVGLRPDDVLSHIPAVACNANATRHGIPQRSLGLTPHKPRDVRWPLCFWLVLPCGPSKSESPRHSRRQRSYHLNSAKACRHP